MKRSGFGALVEDLANVGNSAYKAARRKLKELREPARRYRSIQRNPERHLEPDSVYLEGPGGPVLIGNSIVDTQAILR